MRPLFEERLRDHIKIRRTEIERARHKTKGIGRHPPRNNVEFGQNLNQKVDIMIKSFEELVKSQPPEFNPAFYF